MTQNLAEPLFDLSEIVNNLVTEDDEPVDNILSEKLQRLLPIILYASWTPPPDEDNPDAPRPFWASANVGVFYSVHAPALVPDVFVSLDVVPPADLHAKTGRSYLAWEQGKMPEVVVEIVSNRKGGELTTKLRDYARQNVSYYVVFDPFLLLSRDVLRVYELLGWARRYSLRSDYALPAVGLRLTLWAGRFEGVEYHQWLRWCDADGNLLATPEEAKAAETDRADRAAARAAEAEQRAARLAERLRALGLDPEQL